MSMILGPKDLLYKPVVDSRGVELGTVVNLTQNGSGNFDVFGIRIDDAVAEKVNNGRKRPVSHLFLDVDTIGQVDKVVRLKKALEEL